MNNHRFFKRVSLFSVPPPETAPEKLPLPPLSEPAIQPLSSTEREEVPSPLIVEQTFPSMALEAIQKPPEKAIVLVQGMHCASCVVRVERKLKQVEGVQAVRVDGISGKAELVCGCIPSIEQLHQAVQAEGYTVVAWQDRKTATRTSAERNTWRDYLEIGLIMLALGGLALIVSRWSFPPAGIGISDKMGYGIVFVFGLIASVSSCAAATGGLLIGMTTAYNQRREASGALSRLQPALLFNLGRLLSYTCFGAVIGSLGSLFTLSPQVNGTITLGAAIIMVLLGIQLLKLLPWARRFQPRMPTWLAHKVYDASGKPSECTFFLVGAGTFFLPCGFTQALQIYVLGRGNPLVGALTMLVFALGTFPALLFFSAISAALTGVFQRHMVKVSGVLVLLIGLLNFSSGLAIAGIAFPSFAPVQSAHATHERQVPLVEGKQVVTMKVVGFTYTPSTFTVVAGVPVIWHVDGSRAEGCADVLTAPDLGINAVLPVQGSTTIVFIPPRSGAFSFRCPMAMTTAGARFIVLPHSQTT